MSRKPQFPRPSTAEVVKEPISGPSPNDVVEITYSLNNKKTSDVNGLSINMLKQIVECIAEPLSIIFTASIEQGIFPHIFKVSKTVPVFKKEGSRTNVNNYRPISIVNTFSKILEKYLSSRLLNKYPAVNLDFFPKEIHFSVFCQ